MTRESCAPGRDDAAPVEIDRLVMPSLIQQVIDYRVDKLGA